MDIHNVSNHHLPNVILLQDFLRLKELGLPACAMCKHIHSSSAGAEGLTALAAPSKLPYLRIKFVFLFL